MDGPRVALVHDFLLDLRGAARAFRVLLPLYPHAIESLDLRGYDVVVSSSSAWAHGVLVDPGAVHVCYCHNPFRYAWSEREATLRARGPLLRPPVELERFAPVPVERIGSHYLVLAELMAHKRIDVAIRAFNALGRPLLVVGDGPELRHLRRLAGPTVRVT